MKWKWINTIWAKIVIEFAVTAILWILFTLVKTVLPKRFKLDDQRMKKVLKDLSIVFDNIARPNDTIPQLMSKGKNVFNHFYEKGLSDGVLQEDFKTYISTIEPDYEIITDYQFIENIYTQLEPYCDTFDYVNDIADAKQIIRVNFSLKGKTESIYVLKNSALARPGVNEYQHFFAKRKGFDPYNLIDIFFSRNDDAIHLSFGTKLTVKKLYINNEIYIPDEAQLLTMEKEILKFKEKGFQRSWLLEGPPGTGKSSIAIYLAKRMNGKIAQLDSTIFTNAQDAVIRAILSNLNAQFIIIDDIDHISIRDMSAFLFALASVKLYKEKPTLIATCNNIYKLEKAIIRPGRFDKIFAFHAPTLQRRKDFFNALLKNYKVELDEADINKLAKATDKMTEAYMKEYCLQLMTGISVDEVIKEINDRKKYLGDGDKKTLNLHDLQDDPDVINEVNDMIEGKYEDD